MSSVADLDARFFEGITPSIIATCGRDGTPNVAYVSQVFRVDDKHVALSCQFFNKTRRNLEENPHAHIEIYDPLTFDAFHLELKFVCSEKTGPLFDRMFARIEAIASHTGMKGVFKLLSADRFEVLSVTPSAGYRIPGDDGEPVLPAVRDGSELRLLNVLCDRVNRARTLDELLGKTLLTLDELCGFAHSMVLIADEHGRHLQAIASHGYGEEGIGAEVECGDGLIGTAAATRSVLRVAGLDAELRYGRAIRTQAQAGGSPLPPEIPLPGLADPGSALAIPLTVGDRLVGVLALESRNVLAFEDWHEAFLQILGNQIAGAIERFADTEDDEDEPEAARSSPARPLKRHTFLFYPHDDCIFVDGEYLIRNLPGRILWKLLSIHRKEGRREFTNRELRLDESLGLPPIKDNLESRLILLRKRLEQKCPDVRIVPVRRGRFALEVACELDLQEQAAS